MFTRCTNCKAISPMSSEELEKSNRLTLCKECQTIYDPSKNFSNEEIRPNGNEADKDLSKEHLQIVSSLDDWQSTSLDEQAHLVEANEAAPQNTSSETYSNEEHLLEASQTSPKKSHESPYEAADFKDDTNYLSDEVLQTASSLDDWQSTHSNESSTETTPNHNGSDDTSNALNSPENTDLLDDKVLEEASNSLSEYIENTRQEITKKTDSSIKSSDVNESNQSNNLNEEEEQGTYSFRRSSSEEFTVLKDKDKISEFPFKPKYIDELIFDSNNNHNIEEKDEEEEEDNSYKYRRSSSEEFSAPKENKNDDLNFLRPKHKNINQEDSYQNQAASDNPNNSVEKPAHENELNFLDFKRRNHQEPSTQVEKNRNAIEGPINPRQNPVAPTNKQEKKNVVTKPNRTKPTSTEDTPAAKSRARLSISGPIYATIVLSLFLSIQIAFNYRHILLDVPKNAPEKVQMINHNIFAHPIENNVLLISADIENEANFDQPFPTLEVRLNNSNGELIALRRFSPKEYLETFTKGQVFQKRQANNIKLQIKDPGNQATRFQFNFL